MSNESVMLSDHLILCHPLLLLLSIFPSNKVFSNESALLITWPTYWSFSISPSSEYSGLISFRIDWFDLLAVQRALKSLLQHHSLKASISRPSAFSVVQLSHQCVFLSWLQSPSTMILESKKRKLLLLPLFPPSICREVMGSDATVLVFRMWSFKPAFALSSFTLIKRLLSSSSLSATRVVQPHIWVYWYYRWVVIFPSPLHSTVGNKWGNIREQD